MGPVDIAGVLAREGPKYPPAPAGVTPNYVDPESNGDMFMEGSLITLCVAFVCLLLRLATKTFMAGRRISWDDGKYPEPWKLSGNSKLTSLSARRSSFGKTLRLFEHLSRY